MLINLYYVKIVMQQATYLINGKEIVKDVICFSKNVQMYKHSYIHHNSRCYCKNCGASRGVIN